MASQQRQHEAALQQVRPPWQLVEVRVAQLTACCRCCRLLSSCSC
jgi:hypothetical protein